MSIVITTDVFCDGCYQGIHGYTSSKVNARTARENAKRDGWVRHWSRKHRRMQDLCPQCAAISKTKES